MIKKSLYILGVFIISFGSFFGQESSSGLEIWSSFKVNYKLNKKWSIKFKNQERYYLDSNTIGLVYLQGVANRRLNKHNELLFRYRYSFDIYEEHNMNRFSIGHKLGYEVFKNLKIENRFLFQFEQRVYTGEPFSTFRDEINLNYKLKKNKFSLAYEIFINEMKNINQWQLRTHRLSLDYKRKLNKSFKLQGFYRINFKVNRKTNRKQSILGVGLLYEI